MHWIDVQGQVLRDQQGQPVRMLGVVTDITERKQLEQQKDSFLSMVSHELKTPLTSLQGFTQLMQRTAAKRQDPTYERHLLKINEQIVRLNNLVTDLLDVTRLQQSKLQYRFVHFSMAQCVIEMVENFREISHYHQLMVNGTVAREVYGDPNRIGHYRQALRPGAAAWAGQRLPALARQVVLHRGRCTLNRYLCDAPRIASVACRIHMSARLDGLTPRFPSLKYSSHRCVSSSYLLAYQPRQPHSYPSDATYRSLHRFLFLY